MRPGLDPELVARVRDLLIGMDQTESGRQILEQLKKTRKFDALPPESEEALRELSQMVELVSVK